MYHRHADSKISPKSHEQLAEGAWPLLGTYALSSRGFVGRTALPPELSFCMCNMARIREGSFVLDPFAGSASLLLSAAHWGARTVGVDISEKALLGADGSGSGVRDNFEREGLEPPERLVVGDATELISGELLGEESRFSAFDAVITDPPYGVMEGLGALYLPLPLRVRTLLQLAATRLKTGGRLVFLLPTPSECTDPREWPIESPSLPLMPCFEVEALGRQVIRPIFPICDNPPSHPVTPRHTPSHPVTPRIPIYQRILFLCQSDGSPSRAGCIASWSHCSRLLSLRQKTWRHSRRRLTGSLHMTA